MFTSTKIPILAAKSKRMKQEEDFDFNLAGDEGNSTETRSSWFKRIKKGILTSTAEKRKHLKDSGASALDVDIFAPLPT